MIDPSTQESSTSGPLSWNLASFLKVLPGLFMMTFLLIGAVSVLSQRATYQWQGGSWNNGEATSRYEAHFNDNLPLKDAYISTWGIIEYGLFNQAREGALVGREGWFFTSEEVAYYEDEAARIEEKLAYISKVRDELAAQDIDLVVTLVPAKARIYPENLGFALPDYVVMRYDTELQALAEANIDTIDLREALLAAKAEGQTYFKTDTHWTPFGARVAAAAIREGLESKGYALPFDESTFATNPAEGLTQHEGDLMQFLPLGILSERLAPAPESLQEATTVQTNVGLFADTSRPVTLVGTSYSGDARWNFEGALKESLGLNVLNAALVGRGEIVPMESYLESDNPVTNKPQLIIWQLSERGFPMAASAELEGAELESSGEGQ